MIKKVIFILFFFIAVAVFSTKELRAQSLSPTLINPGAYKNKNDGQETKKTILGILVYENGWYIFYDGKESDFVPLSKLQIKYNRCFSCEPTATKKSDGSVELLFRYQDQLKDFILAVFLKQYNKEDR